MATISAQPPNSIESDKKEINDKEETGRSPAEAIVFFLTFFWYFIEAIFRLIVPVQKKSVKDEIVLITGAGSGIGRELALQYASLGAVVVCWDINEKGNSETVRDINKLGLTKAYGYVCDVAKEQHVVEVANRVKRDVGDVGILVNNAGVMPAHPFLSHTVEEFHRIMDVNIMAHFWTVRAFLPAMLKNNHGHIVAISSVVGLVGSRNLVPYTASKFAVRGLMEGLLHELSYDPKCRVKTTTIYPTAVSSNLFDINRWKSKFPQVFRSLSTNAAAKRAINAQRSDFVEHSLPRHLLSFVSICRLLPVKSAICMSRFTDVRVESDL